MTTEVIEHIINIDDLLKLDTVTQRDIFCIGETITPTKRF